MMENIYKYMRTPRVRGRWCIQFQMWLRFHREICDEKHRELILKLLISCFICVCVCI